MRVLLVLSWTLIGCGSSTLPAPNNEPAPATEQEPSLVAAAPAEPGTEVLPSEGPVLEAEAPIEQEGDTAEPAREVPGDEPESATEAGTTPNEEPEPSSPPQEPVDPSLPVISRIGVYLSRTYTNDASHKARAIEGIQASIATLRQEDCEVMEEPDIRLLLSYRDHPPLRECLRAAEPYCRQLDAADIEASEEWAARSDDGQVRSYTTVHSYGQPGVMGGQRAVLVFGSRQHERAIECTHAMSDPTAVHHYRWGRRALVHFTMEEATSFDCSEDGEEMRCYERADCEMLATRGGRLLLAGCDVDSPEGIVTASYASVFGSSARFGSIEVDGDIIVYCGRRLRLVRGALVPE